MKNIKYRPAELKDLDTLYEFEQGIVSAERPMDPTLKEGHINYYDLKELIEEKQAEVMLAEVDSEIVGSGYVKIMKAKPYLAFEHYGHVGFIYVRPEYRRKGISQTIITKLIHWAKSKNIIELRLEVYEENHKAVASYEKLGMKKHLIEMRMPI